MGPMWHNIGSNNAVSRPDLFDQTMEGKGKWLNTSGKDITLQIFIMNMFSFVFCFTAMAWITDWKRVCGRADLYFHQKRIISHQSFPFDFWLTFAYTSDQRSSLWKDTSSTGARSRTSQSPATRAARRPTARRRTRWTWEVSARYRHVMRWW